MSRIEVALVEGRVLIEPLPVNVELSPEVPDKDISPAVELVRVHQPGSQPGRNADAAPERRQQHAMLGAVAFTAAGYFARGGKADAQILLLDVLAHELSEPIHQLVWVFLRAGGPLDQRRYLRVLVIEDRCGREILLPFGSRELRLRSAAGAPSGGPPRHAHHRR